MKKILLLIAIATTSYSVGAQISAGPVLGTNLSRVENFSINKEMLRPGIYGGLYTNYKFNDWFSVGLEAAWSEKSETFFNSERYSSFAKLQTALSMIYPELPDIGELIEMMTGVTGITFNDTITESNNGMVTFKSIELPLTARFTYKKFSFDAGGYYSFLIGAKTENTFLQESPLFEMIPMESLNMIPMLPQFISMTFPALNEPQFSTSTSTKYFAQGDYGLVAGFSYKPDDFLTLSLRYTHGLAQKLSPMLPSDKTHSTIRFSIAYNIFGKVLQKPIIN
jgi:hypothetical protein